MGVRGIAEYLSVEVENCWLFWRVGGDGWVYFWNVTAVCRSSCCLPKENFFLLWFWAKRSLKYHLYGFRKVSSGEMSLLNNPSLDILSPKPTPFSPPTPP